MHNPKKIAIVYDWIDSWGGVERMLLELKNIFPQASFYTSYVDFEKAPWARNLEVHTSFIQRLPSFVKNNRLLSLFLYPYAFESFQFDDYELVISLSSAFAKGIVVKPGSRHISLILTPMRYVWVTPQSYKRNKFIAFLFDLFASRLMHWDFIAAQRPDKLVAISEVVQKRIKKYYHRESEVIYPPFNKEYWQELEQQQPSQLRFDNYYLVVSRLEPYKKIELVIETFKTFPDKNLVIVGKGTNSNYLHKIKGVNCTFLENCTDSEIAWLYAHANALIMPQEEDFGYVSLEAQSLECPVIAYAKGGALETVINKKTGIFFSEQSISSLSDAVETFHTMSYNGRKLAHISSIHLKKFDSSAFRDKLLDIIRKTNV